MKAKQEECDECEGKGWDLQETHCKGKLEKVEKILKNKSERKRLKEEAHRWDKENKEEKKKREKGEKIEKKRRLEAMWENLRWATKYFDDEENLEWEEEFEKEVYISNRKKRKFRKD